MLTVTTWTWDEEPGTELTVDVYSGCEEVELFLNGKSLGTKKTSRATEFIASWHVPYHPGELKAVGYKDGNAVDGHVLRSASKPAKLTLAADRASIRADGNDISYITVEVTGGNGVMNPLADHEISFTVSGPATVAAVGNSSPYAPLDYPFHGSKCRTFEGRAVLIVRSTPDAGTIKIKATANGLDAGEVAIVSK
jgi:beta-galactosidase